MSPRKGVLAQVRAIVKRETILVELTRRNLQVLLAKLDGNPPGSFREITRFADNSPDWIVVRAVEDEVHYHDRAPGQMHPDTEAAI